MFLENEALQCSTGTFGQRPAAAAGATLFYGPGQAQPDLILAAQFLMDDLRAVGTGISSLRVNRHTLRLRFAGAELALALSAAPLPPGSLPGLLRPVEAPHRPARRAAASAEGASDHPDNVLTDLGTIRVARAVQAHNMALGVILRRRGPAGPAEPDAALQMLLAPLLEAAPASAVLWQGSAVIYSLREFQQLRPADLRRPGRTAPALLQVQAAAPAVGTLPATTGSGLSATPRSRADRAARRSAGRLFGRAGKQHPNRPLPLHPPSFNDRDRLAEALRRAEGTDQQPAFAPLRRFGGNLVLGLWFAVILPEWSALMALLQL